MTDQLFRRRPFSHLIPSVLPFIPSPPSSSSSLHPLTANSSSPICPFVRFTLLVKEMGQRGGAIHSLGVGINRQARALLSAPPPPPSLLCQLPSVPSPPPFSAPNIPSKVGTRQRQTKRERGKGREQKHTVGGGGGGGRDSAAAHCKSRFTHSRLTFDYRTGIIGRAFRRENFQSAHSFILSSNCPSKHQQ